MASTDHRVLIQRWMAMFHEKDTAAIDFRPLATDDFVRHDPNIGDTHGPDGERELALVYRAAFPDLTLEIEHLVIEGDLIVAHLTARGTHRGELLGIPPSGASISVSAVDIFRVEDGRMAEQWTVMDSLGLMQQLGAIPAASATNP